MLDIGDFLGADVTAVDADLLVLSQLLEVDTMLVQDDGRGQHQESEGQPVDMIANKHQDREKDDVDHRAGNDPVGRKGTDQAHYYGNRRVERIDTGGQTNVAGIALAALELQIEWETVT